MKENISPEERLLRLIKGQKKENPAISDEKKPDIVAEELKSTVKRSKFPSTQKYISIPYLRRIVWLAFTLSCISIRNPQPMTQSYPLSS